MKKFIFGCFLMLCGAMCGTGWLIAVSSLVQGGTWSTMLNVFPGIGFGRPDGYVIFMFYIIAIVGGIMAWHAVKDDEASSDNAGKNGGGNTGI